ncbi:MAG TPA: hypothetical protein VH476_09760 [Solirubrobacterales bacterium]
MVSTKVRGIMCSRFGLCIALALAFAALSALADAAPAFAERAFEGEMTGISGPFAIAIDGQDRVWVQEANAGSNLSEYDAFPSHTKIGELSGEGHHGNTVRSFAIDNSNNELYFADSGPVVIVVYDRSTGAYQETWTTENSCGYLYAAVDNSGGAHQGRVYVARTCSGPQHLRALIGHNEPDPFSASDEYISENRITGTPSGTIGEIGGLATDVEGNFYVVDRANHVVDKFESSGHFAGEFTGADVPGGFGQLVGVAVDPTDGDVLVVDSSAKAVDEFAPGGEYVGQITGPEGSSFGSLNGGIAVNSSGMVYVSDQSKNVVDIFGSNAILPKITYGAVTEQTQTSGTVHATVELNGGPEVESCTIQYGTTTAYGSTAECSPSAPYTGTTAISGELSGLTTETTYHYRVVLVTANGTKKGIDQTYLPHAVAGLTTLPATSVERNTATLNGTYNGNGEDTHYFFEWGTTTGYGNTTATPPGVDKGTGTGPQSLTFNLSGLTVETTYHYRVVASNGAGTSYGTDQSFKTLAAVEELATEPATEVTATKAKLNATYTGIGEDVHYYFEYGPTSSYGSESAAPPGTDAGSPSGPQTLSFNVSGLEVNAVYHYRIVAIDAAGTTVGDDVTFRTLGRYGFAEDLGSSGSGAGQFVQPRDVAVDASSGDIYVADTGNHRVVRLGPSGTFISAWGWGVSDGNPSAEICTSSCQAGIAGSGAGQFQTPKFIEVDNSGGPSSGDVYVGDVGDNVVQKFDPTGNLITSWKENGAADRSHDGTIGGITVDNIGDLFVLTTDTPYYWTEIGQDGTFETQLPTEGGIVGGSLGTPGGTGIEISGAEAFYELQQAGGGVRYTSPDAAFYATYELYGPGVPAPSNTGITIDRTVDDIYVDQGGYIDQFASSDPQNCTQQGCIPSDTFGSGSLSGATGLAIDSSNGTLYAANTGNDDIAVFTPLPVPEATTEAAAVTGETTATLKAHVDPNGPGQISDCYFEFGETSEYELGTQPCNPGTPLSAPTNVTANVSGLTPFGTYHFRIVAIRADGKGFPARGRDQTLTPAPSQAPSVDETSFSEVAPTEVTLNALINPNKASTSYRFQYGTTTSYGSQTLPSEPIGSDGVDHAVSSPITGLQPGTTYHFRVVAVNFNGPTQGQDMTFSTPSAPTIIDTTASAITTSAANLAATLGPGFRATTYHFEYGLTSSYGGMTLESSSIGTDNSGHPVAATVSGLAPSTTYHYRVVASNEIGTTDGPDETFTTASPPPQASPPPASTVCRKGFVKKHGKCVKKKPKKHHRHKGKRNRKGRRNG